MKCKSCTKTLPTKRIELGFKHCTDCSTVDTYGTVDITYHKTGNTVQHIDKETASKINKYSRRNTYGSSLGKIKSGGPKEFSGKIEVGCSTATVGSQGMFDKVGNEMMFQYDLHGFDKALTYLERCHKNLSINQTQYIKLKQTLQAFSQL
jgi:hypothetical protein